MNLPGIFDRGASVDEQSDHSGGSRPTLLAVDHSPQSQAQPIATPTKPKSTFQGFGSRTFEGPFENHRLISNRSSRLLGHFPFSLIDWTAASACTATHTQRAQGRYSKHQPNQFLSIYSVFERFSLWRVFETRLQEDGPLERCVERHVGAGKCTTCTFAGPMVQTVAGGLAGLRHMLEDVAAQGQAHEAMHTDSARILQQAQEKIQALEAEREAEVNKRIAAEGKTGMFRKRGAIAIQRLVEVKQKRRKLVHRRRQRERREQMTPQKIMSMEEF